MTSANPERPSSTHSVAVTISADALSLRHWLDVVAGDERVSLPQPAWRYLAEARATEEE